MAEQQGSNGSGGKTVALGSDQVGQRLRLMLATYLREAGCTVVEFGDAADDTYGDVAVRVARLIADGAYDRAVLVCGTGIGMSIAANKVSGVYAALCHDTYSAERARLSNNAQVLTLGSRVIGDELAKRIVDTWLRHDFIDGPSTPKLARLAVLEREVMGGGPAA